MSTSSREHQREVDVRRPRHTRRHPGASPSHLSDLGADVIATRLRTLGHPTRLRIMGVVDGRPSTADGLAEDLGEPVGVVRAHLCVLHRAGVVCRVDDDGPARYELVDWPSLWLVEQLAYRLRQRALEETADADEEPVACR